MTTYLARERIETEDFSVTGGQNCLVLKDDVDKICVLERCRPFLSARGSI